MTTEPNIEAAAVEGAPTGGTGPISPRSRIRWGWFLGCIVLGLAAIIVGWFLVSPTNRLGYVGGVLGGIGTTLLLVGIVVLLERRIVDTAVKVVREATKEARIRTDEAVRAQVRDFEDRVARVWETATPENAAEETRRMIDQFTKRVVDVYTGDDQTPPGKRNPG
ncbi:hypothetical protein [Agromyces bauzanensis]